MSTRKFVDGVWTHDGLRAEFEHLWPHPCDNGYHRVRTAGGEHYAHEQDITWWVSLDGDNAPHEPRRDSGVALDGVVGLPGDER